MKTKTVYLADLDLTDISMGWPIPPHVNCTVKGTLLCVGGSEFKRGVWMNANCRIPIALGGRGVRFRGMCGPDDLVPQSQASCMEFLVETEGNLRFRSGRMVQGDAAVAVDVDLAGAETLTLILDSVDGKVISLSPAEA